MHCQQGVKGIGSIWRHYVLAIAGNASYLVYLLLITLSLLTLLAVEPGEGTPPRYGPCPDCERLWNRRSLCSDVYTMFHDAAELVNRIAIGW